MPDLGARIQEMRKKADLSRAELAEEIGVSGMAIWNWEAGKTRPRPETLRRVADALGTTEAALLTGQSPQDRKRSVKEIVEAARQEIADATGYDVSRIRLTLEFQE